MHQSTYLTYNRSNYIGKNKWGIYLNELTLFRVCVIVGETHITLHVCYIRLKKWINSPFQTRTASTQFRLGKTWWTAYSCLREHPASVRALRGTAQRRNNGVLASNAPHAPEELMVHMQRAGRVRMSAGHRTWPAHKNKQSLYAHSSSAMQNKQDGEDECPWKRSSDVMRMRKCHVSSWIKGGNEE